MGIIDWLLERFLSRVKIDDEKTAPDEESLCDTCIHGDIYPDCPNEYADEEIKEMLYCEQYKKGS